MSERQQRLVDKMSSADPNKRGSTGGRAGSDDADAKKKSRPSPSASGSVGSSGSKGLPAPTASSLNNFFEKAIPSTKREVVDWEERSRGAYSTMSSIKKSASSKSKSRSSGTGSSRPPSSSRMSSSASVSVSPRKDRNRISSMSGSATVSPSPSSPSHSSSRDRVSSRHGRSGSSGPAEPTIQEETTDRKAVTRKKSSDSLQSKEMFDKLDAFLEKSKQSERTLARDADERSRGAYSTVSKLQKSSSSRKASASGSSSRLKSSTSSSRRPEGGSSDDRIRKSHSGGSSGRPPTSSSSRPRISSSKSVAPMSPSKSSPIRSGSSSGRGDGSGRSRRSVSPSGKSTGSGDSGLGSFMQAEARKPRKKESMETRSAYTSMTKVRKKSVGGGSSGSSSRHRGSDDRDRDYTSRHKHMDLATTKESLNENSETGSASKSTVQDELMGFLAALPKGSSSSSKPGASGSGSRDAKSMHSRLTATTASASSSSLNNSASSLPTAISTGGGTAGERTSRSSRSHRSGTDRPSGSGEALRSSGRRSHRIFNPDLEELKEGDEEVSVGSKERRSRHRSKSRGRPSKDMDDSKKRSSSRHHRSMRDASPSGRSSRRPPGESRPPPTRTGRSDGRDGVRREDRPRSKSRVRRDMEKSSSSLNYEDGKDRDRDRERRERDRERDRDKDGRRDHHRHSSYHDSFSSRDRERRSHRGRDDANERSTGSIGHGSRSSIGHSSRGSIGHGSSSGIGRQHKSSSSAGGGRSSRDKERGDRDRDGHYRPRSKSRVRREKDGDRDKERDRDREKDRDPERKYSRSGADGRRDTASSSAYRSSPPSSPRRKSGEKAPGDGTSVASGRSHKRQPSSPGKEDSRGRRPSETSVEHRRRARSLHKRKSERKLLTDDSEGKRRDSSSRAEDDPARIRKDEDRDGRHRRSKSVGPSSKSHRSTESSDTPVASNAGNPPANEGEQTRSDSPPVAAKNRYATLLKSGGAEKKEKAFTELDVLYDKVELSPGLYMRDVMAHEEELPGVPPLQRNGGDTTSAGADAIDAAANPAATSARVQPKDSDDASVGDASAGRRSSEQSIELSRVVDAVPAEEREAERSSPVSPKTEPVGNGNSDLSPRSPVRKPSDQSTPSMSADAAAAAASVPEDEGPKAIAEPQSTEPELPVGDEPDGPPVDYNEEDIFSFYSWSTARQNNRRILLERKKLKESLRDTALYRAFQRVNA